MKLIRDLKVLWILILILIVIRLILFPGRPLGQRASTSDWGSFTIEETASFDGRFTAAPSVERVDGINMAVVSIRENGEDVYSFMPARMFDFWGVCWEKDTYTIWIQSGDVGVKSWFYADGTWHYDDVSLHPKYIHTKWENED